MEKVADILESMLELDAFVGPQHPWLVELQGYALARWEYLESAGQTDGVPAIESTAESTEPGSEAGETEPDTGFLGGLKNLFKKLGGSSSD